MKPILKWAGGKSWMVDRLRAAMPSTFRRYYEPFAGGAALFFSGAADGHHAILADENVDLMKFYRIVRDEPERLIAACSDFAVTKENYYAARDQWDHERATPVERAARFLYLNKTCFNGLWRVNGKGLFNVPWGKKAPDLAWIDAEAIMSASRMLADAILSYAVDCDSLFLRHANEGDFVYLDPPYDTDGANFTKYTTNGFDRAATDRLFRAIRELSARGVYVLASNAATSHVMGVLNDAHALGGVVYATTFSAPRRVGAKTRARAQEVLFSNYPRALGSEVDACGS